ncbi:MAG: sulfatase-like hydrolase/transferase, partial [Bacteroidota bacterium]
MKKLIIPLLLTAFLYACNNQHKKEDVATTGAGEQLDRTVLPIKEPKRQTYTELDVRNAKAPERFHVTAPKGAPNVVVILIDDMGFGVSEAFGGPVTTPNMDKLADNGLRYNRFHTTALCSPTRVALLTGYNHHSNNMGCIGEAA